VGTRGGEYAGETEETAQQHEHEMVLWTEKHDFAPHLMIIVASPDRSVGAADLGDGDESAPETEAAGVGMLECSIAIEYHVDQPRDYLYRYEQPETVIEAVAFQTLTDYAASVDLDQVIGPGREQFERDLRERIQQRVDELQVGVKLAFLGLHGAHPPAEQGVAKAYQDVVSQERRKRATIEEALGQAQEIKTKVAGSVAAADALDAAIMELERLVHDPDATDEQRGIARRHVDDLLLGNPAEGVRPASGQVAAMIAAAQADNVALVSDAESKLTEFANEVAAYRAAPRLYRMRKWLEMLTAATQGVRKVVLAGDLDEINLVFEIEMEKQGVLDLTAEPEPASGR